MRTRITVALAALISLPCFGWGREGHQIAGAIAWHFMNDKAKAAVDDLLGGQPIGAAGNWADELHGDKNYDWAKPLHYINVPRNATTCDQARDCKNGECVLGAIDRFAGVLRDKTSTRARKTEALKFLIHFVQDVHQPLHASYADDKGGNTVKVTWYGKQTNFHHVWDNELIEQRIGREDWMAYADKLAQTITQAQLKKWRSEKIDPDLWANESLTITRRLYPDLPRNGTLDQKYFERNIPVAEERLQAAGVRLAMLLNDIFGDSTSPAATSGPSASQPATAPDEQGALSFIAIIADEQCGKADGKGMFLVNRHDSQIIKVKVLKSWSAHGKKLNSEQTYFVRPGADKRKFLGCSRVKMANDEALSFEWTIVEASIEGR